MRNKGMQYIIEQLNSNQFDMVASTLTISKARWKIVDFSVPFDVSILFLV